MEDDAERLKPPTSLAGFSRGTKTPPLSDDDPLQFADSSRVRHQPAGFSIILFFFIPQIHYIILYYIYYIYIIYIYIYIYIYIVTVPGTNVAG